MAIDFKISGIYMNLLTRKTGDDEWEGQAVYGDTTEEEFLEALRQNPSLAAAVTRERGWYQIEKPIYKKPSEPTNTITKCKIEEDEDSITSVAICQKTQKQVDLVGRIAKLETALRTAISGLKEAEYIDSKRNTQSLLNWTERISEAEAVLGKAVE